MSPVLSALLVPASVASSVALVALSALIWRRGERTDAALFSLIALSFLAWLFALTGAGVGLLYAASIAFAPAFAIHAAVAQSGRRTATVWLAYIISGILFLMYTAPPPAVSSGVKYAVLFGVLYFVAAVVFVASEMFPLTNAANGVRPRRQAAYATIGLILFLVTGMRQMVAQNSPGIPILLAACTWVLISVGTVRARLYGATASWLEIFYIALFSIAVGSLLAVRGSSSIIILSISSLVLIVFGAVAIVVHRRAVVERDRQAEAIASAVHQWMGTVAGIRAATELIHASAETSPSAETHVRHAESIGRAADRLRSMLESHLIDARLQTGAGTSAPEPTDVCQVVEETLEDLEPLAEAKGLTLTARCEGIPPTTLVSATAFRSAMFNLVENAIKYTDEGTIDVRVRMENGRLILTVTDTGMGLSPELADGLFSRFRRGRTASRIPGAGLGLSVVDRLVREADGSLRAESAGTGLGSTFVVCLPIENE